MDLSYKIVQTAIMIAAIAGLVGVGAVFLQSVYLFAGAALLSVACMTTALVTIIVDAWSS
jgi:hypothetical protein